MSEHPIPWFEPRMTEYQVATLRARWDRALGRAKDWEEKSAP